jgi:hypothetical protein
MPFDPTDPKFASPLASITQDRLTGMMNQPQTKVFAAQPQDSGTTPGSAILPGQTQLNQIMGMAKGGLAQQPDELSGIKNQIRGEFAARGLDFDRFVSNPAVMDEVGKSIQSHGKNGDTILAHINPEEAQLLKEMGGSGDINVHTGLPQFYFGDISSYGGSTPSGSSSSYDGRDSSSSNQSPSYGGGSSWSGGGNSFSNSGGGSFSDFGGSMVSDGGSMGGVDYNDGGADFGGQNVSSWSGGGNGGGGSFGISGVRPVAFGGGSSQTSISPTGVGGGSVSMGSQQPQVNEASSSIPSFAGVDPMSGIPIGGASNISGLGQLATVPSLAAAPTIGAGPVDLGNTRPEISDINFSDMNAGMYPGATMPGGISNFAASPIDPGYTDIGVTAMRMGAGQMGEPGTYDRKTGIGQGAEFNLNKLNEFDPVSQTQGATILNRMMDLGYNPGFDRYGVGRTFADQAALNRMADEVEARTGNRPQTASPGNSMHNFGLAMDVENLNDQGYRDLARIAAEEGWGSGGSADPAHVQMAPWGAGAMQTAQRLGAQPFTGSSAPQMATSSSPLREALNTSSEIASELFGVKSANAAEQPQNAILENQYRATDPFGGEEIMSPFVGNAPALMAFPPRSQDQMLSALGIRPGPVNPVPAAQIAGGGVFPSNEQLGIKIQDRAPGGLSPSVEAIRFQAPPTPMERFGLPGEMATFGSEYNPMDVPRPDEPIGYPRMGVDVFGPLGPMNLSELSLSNRQPAQEAERAPPLTRGITAPAPIQDLALTRAEIPSLPTSPMTADQLKNMGIYKDTLQPGETIRQDFNSAYADATKRGIDVFEWTNPKTGATSVYRSGSFEADLPSRKATPANLPPEAKAAQQAPQTEYDKTIATLEDAGQIANGMSKEEYAAAMGVPVEEVKTRITTQFGPPMAEYYTKTVFESLAGMTGDKGNFAGAMNLMSLFSPLGILGLGGKALYNRYKSGAPEENKAEGGYISPLASMGKR